MEIERKFLISRLPEHLADYPCLLIQQAYLCTDPVIRIRRQDDSFFLTIKGKGMMSREEHNFPISEDAYLHLLSKADGNIIAKRRYLIPLASPRFQPGFVPKENPRLKIELDLFEPPFAPLVMAEVEFPDQKMAEAFLPPSWLAEDVTNDPAYHNSNLSKQTI